MKIKNTDKVNHYINNLKQYIMFWEKSFLSLHSKVMKVKNDVNFKKFCIEKHDKWEIHVKVLEDFFKKSV